MIAVTVGLLVVVFLKVIAVVNAIRWLHRQGPAFTAALAAQHPRTMAEQERVYDNLEADFFPFGIKDYRIRRFARARQGSRRILVGWLARLFQVTFFNLAMLSVLTATYLILVASMDRLPDLVPRSVDDAFCLVLALTLLIATILIAVEAVYAYAVLGSYALGFHELRPERRSLEKLLVREFQIFVGALIAAHLAGVGATYLVAHRFDGYGKLAKIAPSAARAVLQTLDSSYYTLATFVGSGDPEPLTAAGKLTSGLITLQGLAFLALVLASMLSIPGNERIRTSTGMQARAESNTVAVDQSRESTADCDHQPAPHSESRVNTTIPLAIGVTAGAAGVLAVLIWSRVWRMRRSRD